MGLVSLYLFRTACSGKWACTAGQRRRLEQLNVVASWAVLPHQSGKVTVIVPAGLCWQ